MRFFERMQGNLMRDGFVGHHGGCRGNVMAG